MRRDVPVNSSKRMELTTLDHEPGNFWYGAWKDVNVAVWRQAASAAAVARIDHTIPGRIKALPGRHSTVHIALASVGPPTSEARTAFAESARRWKDITGAVAVVIENNGFLASALRSAVTGIQLLSGTQFPLRAHKSIEEAAPWLVEHHERTARVTHAASDVLHLLQMARTYCT